MRDKTYFECTDVPLKHKDLLVKDLSVAVGSLEGVFPDQQLALELLDPGLEMRVFSSGFLKKGWSGQNGVSRRAKQPKYATSYQIALLEVVS